MFVFFLFFNFSGLVFKKADIVYQLNSGGPAFSYNTNDVLSIESFNLPKNADAAKGKHFPNIFFDDRSLISDNGGLISEIIFLDEKTIKYRVKKGDTLEKVADYFDTSSSTIKKLNGNLKSLKRGEWITVSLDKDMVNPNEQSKNELSELPKIKNYFSLPASGWNWGILHEYNAVDIASKCGSPVYAAAEGVVINDSKFGSGNNSGWNGGYGIFILIDHLNGTKTRYAHLEKSLVKVGDVVKKGEKIGFMGNTGNTHGPTGCHLHFEVYGAQNPFAKN